MVQFSAPPAKDSPNPFAAEQDPAENLSASVQGFFAGLGWLEIAGLVLIGALILYAVSYHRREKREARQRDGDFDFGWDGDGDGGGD